MSYITNLILFRRLIDYWQLFWLNTYDDFHEIYKGLTINPKWLLMRRVSRFKTGRSMMKYLSKLPNKNYEFISSDQSLVFNNIDIDNVVKFLKKDGFYLGLNLPQDIVQEILEFTKNTICYGNRKQEFGFYYSEKGQAQAKYEKDFVVASYFNTALLCPVIKKLESDPTLLKIAAKYFNAEPLHQGNQLWWSFAKEVTYSEQCKASQMFHYDIDDYCFLKFFFYLTDVDLSSGPHVCIRGSHEKKNFLHELLCKRAYDKTIIDHYGSDSVVTICEKAGVGFVEDTLCFHKGTTPTHRDRLMLTIEFAINDYKMQNDIRKNSPLSM